MPSGGKPKVLPMRHLLMLSVAVLALQAAPAHAGPSTVTVTGVSVQGDAVTLEEGHPLASDTTVTAGPITLTTSLGTRLVAWCVDLFHPIQAGTMQNLHYAVGTVTTDNSPSQNTLTAAQLTGVGKLANYGQSLLDTGKGTSDTLAAVQVAIWSTEYGNFQYSGLSSALVSDALAKSASFAATDYGLLAQNGTQTLVVAGSGAAAVPEPASLALVAGGLGLLGALRRRTARPA